jgi:hypothetical protein
MKDLKTVELIDRYLNNELSPAERADVEARLATDAAFAAEVELHRQLGSSLADREQLNLFHLLQQIDGDVPSVDDAPVATTPPPPARRRRIGWGLFVLLLLLLLGIAWWLRPGPAVAPSPGQPVPRLESPRDPATEPAAPTPEAPKTAPAPAPARPRQEPIAALDPAAFRPNRLLEPLAGAQLRGAGEVDFKIAEPVSGATLKPDNGRVRLSVKGVLEAGERPADGAYELALFSNKDEDFIAGKVLRRTAVRVGEPLDGDQAWSFRQVLTLKSSPGLYYLVVVERGGTEPIAVVKFEIRP